MINKNDKPESNWETGKKSECALCKSIKFEPIELPTGTAIICNGCLEAYRSYKTSILDLLESWSTPARVEEQDVKMLEDAASEIERSRELRQCMEKEYGK